MLRAFLLWAALCTAAFAVGYGAGSRRADALETFLDRATLEQDALRGLAAEQAYQLDRITDVRLSHVDSGEIDRLRAELDRTLLFLNEARSAADEKSRLAEQHGAVLATRGVELEECNAVQERLEQQLEVCIFEKAALERHAAAGGGRATSGVSRFSQSIDFPAEPGGN